MLRAIELHNFRCYEIGRFYLGEKGTAWVGPNASGKTSVLEGLQKVALLRGFGKDGEIVRWGASQYRLRALWHNSVVEVVYELGKGTRLFWDGEPIYPLSQWIGRLPVVSLRPGDLNWIEGRAAERRQWADRLLSQAYPEYLSALSQYQRALEQRNALLARADPSPQTELWEPILIREGIFIQTLRYELSKRLSESLQKFYAHFGKEPVQLTYKFSVEPLKETWERAWKRLRKDEYRLKRTLIGPHLEDFIVLLSGQPARGYASEGQKKSLLLALKWAEVAHLHQKGYHPILLLDDIGEKLDLYRLRAVGHLSRLASQTFLTDTDERRIRDIFPEVEIIHTCS
ncbi:MAG: DNA replication and repair protein RecF [Bacteroidia bacterium]|nr:DNA replication and repair protein RecF [Bacteroidia bacterium]